MVWKLPDEFFRRRPDVPEGEEGAAEVADVPAAPEPKPAPAPLREPSRARSTVAGPEARRPFTLPLRAAAILVAGSLALGFLLGRQLLATPGPAPVEPAPSQQLTEVAASPSPSNSEATIHDGPTRIAVPVAVASNCAESGSAALLDSRQDSAWRCEGDGKGRTVTFTFAGAQPIVGLRIASGNPADRDSTKAQRQLLTLRWRFSDGSWFEQGFSGRNGASQEVAFPQIEATGVEMEIVATTPPAEPGAEGADAISIGWVEFLAAE